MDRKVSDILPGLAIFVLIVAVVWFSISNGMLPGRLEESLSESADPRRALMSFSVLISSLSLILVRAGVEVNLLAFAKGEHTRRYMMGLPLWFLLFSAAVSLIGFWNFSPGCKAPETVVFKVSGTDRTYAPLDVIEVSPNESLTLIASSPDDKVLLSCRAWEFVGPAFQSLGEKKGCQANVTFSGQPGSSFISLLVTQNFCDRAALFSLEVQFK